MSTKSKQNLNEIQTIFDENIVSDLKRFLKKRECLNTTNSYFIYLFHLMQSAGILTTSIAASSNNTQLVWIGIGLNVFATLIHVYEKTNNALMKKLMYDINLIKEGHYVDEGALIDTDAGAGSQKNDANSTTPLLINASDSVI